MPQESGDTFTESNGRIHSYLGYVHALLLSLPRQARTAVTSTCTAHRLWRTYILPLLKLCVCLIRTRCQRGWGLVFLKSCRVVLPLSANAAQHASRQWKDSPPWVILPRAVCRRAWWHTSGVHCSALPSPSPPHTALPASLLFTLTFPFPLLFLFLFLKKNRSCFDR